MIFILMLISLIMSVLLVSLKHPLSMGLTLLIQTIMVSLSIGFFSINYWFSYILFLVMIGGMLVLFIYMTSVASNEMFKYSSILMMLVLLISLIMFITYLFIDNFMLYMNIFSVETSNYTFNPNLNLTMNKYLNFPSNFIIYMIIIYLLISMIAVVKITDIKQGPLRQLK